MSRPRSAMRKIREILRLSLSEGLSRRQIGAALGMPYTTVADHLRRTQAAGLTWPLPDGITDAELEARLFGPPAACGPRCPMPDFAEVQRELRQPGVTLQLLWMEYKERFPAGYQYSQYCEHYRRWRRRVDVVMRQEHKAGEKLFVDFAGQKLPITCEETGAATGAQLFVAVLGASSYTYAEATLPGAAPLDRRPRARLRVLRRRSPHRGARQPGERRHPRPPLRARRQPHLRGDGRPLRGRRHPRQARPAT